MATKKVKNVVKRNMPTKKPPLPRVLIIQNDVLCPPASAIEALISYDIPYQLVFAFHNNAFKKLHPLMYEAIIILGGRAGVYQQNNKDKLWLKNEINFVKLALNNKIPILGICLGCQILAYCVGGNVNPGTNGVEIDFDKWFYNNSTKNITQVDPFLYAIKQKNLDQYIVLFHGDTFTLPKEYNIPNSNEILNVKVLAKSNKKGYNMLFKVGNYNYGFQGHPELTFDLVNIWCNAWDQSFLKKSTVMHLGNVVKYAKKYENQMLKASKELFNIWIDIALLKKHEYIYNQMKVIKDTKKMNHEFTKLFDKYLQKFEQMLDNDNIFDIDEEKETNIPTPTNDIPKFDHRNSHNLTNLTISMSFDKVNKGLEQLNDTLTPKLTPKNNNNNNTNENGVNTGFFGFVWK